MVVIASMIAVGGLGQMVLRGIGRLDVGLAAVGGIGIVLLAIILDRLTQSFAVNDKKDKTKWYQKGPIGLVYNQINKGEKIDEKYFNKRIDLNHFSRFTVWCKCKCGKNKYCRRGIPDVYCYGDP